MKVSASERSTIAAVSVNMVVTTPPEVRIERLGYLYSKAHLYYFLLIFTRGAIISSSTQLTLLGFVSPSFDTLEWTSNQLDLDHTSNVLTPRSSINLVIRANVLVPGTKYSFSLKATNRNGTGTAEVDILHCEKG